MLTYRKVSNFGKSFLIHSATYVKWLNTQTPTNVQSFGFLVKLL